MLQAFLVSTTIVTLAEIGDKTQLLTLVLATRYRRPLPLILGVLAATLLNHALAAAMGVWVSNALGPKVLRWLLGLSFLAMAAWVLIPDRPGSTPQEKTRGWLGVFATAFAALFLAEMGDKTQIATVALAARYGTLGPVIAGTTLGMMIANVPVALAGGAIGRRVPARPLHIIAAILFAALGAAALLGVGTQ